MPRNVLGQFAKVPGSGSIRVDFRPVGKPRAAWGQKGTLGVKRALEIATKDHAIKVMKEVSQYPAPGVPYKSLLIEDRVSYDFYKYIRTMTLLKSWVLYPRENLSGYIVTIKNNATDYRGRSYAGYVHGEPGVPGGQQWYHSAHGWRSIYDEKYLDRAGLKRRVEAIWKRWLDLVSK